MKTLHQTYEIHAPRENVWYALVDPKIIEEWGAGPAKMSEKIGKFSLWGGDIHGKNIEVIKNKKLVQEWYGGNWEKPSHVTFTLQDKGDTTIIELEHTEIPDDEAKSIDEGWKHYYLGEIKKLLEKT